MPEKFRYTKENPYIGKGLNRYSKKGKEYTEAEADFAEFNDLYLTKSYNGSTEVWSANEIDEYVNVSINLKRKNYICKMKRDDSVKKVGNTVKSRKLSGYLSKFLNKALDLLIDGDGLGFVNAYYDYIDDIYNYRISVRDIASKGSIKKSLEDYEEDCKKTTKSGSKKSRQAWYELALRSEIKYSPGDILFYVNTGAKKGDGDVKRIVHQYVKNPENPDEEIELVGKVKTNIVKSHCEKNGLLFKGMKDKEKKEILKQYITREEDEIILNCKAVPQEIIDSEKELLCSDVPELEYNVEKYITQFNNRITPLLVCFHPDVRDRILIRKPAERVVWEKDDVRLVSGFPMDEKDQDTYEALMTPERSEVEFWLRKGEVPPFVNECGIDWGKVVADYHETLRKEQDEMFQKENDKYMEALSKLTDEDVERFEEEGELPKSITDIVTLSPKDMRFYFNLIPDMTPSTGGYVLNDIVAQSLEEEDEAEILSDDNADE